MGFDPSLFSEKQPPSLPIHGEEAGGMGRLGIWVGIKSLTPSLGAVSARLARTTPPVSPMKGETFFSVTK